MSEQVVQVYQVHFGIAAIAYRPVQSDDDQQASDLPPPGIKKKLTNTFVAGTRSILYLLLLADGGEVQVGAERSEGFGSDRFRFLVADEVGIRAYPVFKFGRYIGDIEQ